MLAAVGQFLASSLPAFVGELVGGGTSAGLAERSSSAGEEEAQSQTAVGRHPSTPLLATMRDPTASISTLKRAAPVEDGLMPEQYYTLNPEFLTDTEKWTYRDLQRLAKQLGVPGGGKGSRKELEERLATFNRENERALEEDPERWPQQASNFNLVPVNIELKHAAATAAAAACPSGRSHSAAAAEAEKPAPVPAGLVVDVPSALRSNTSALISPLIASSKKRKAGDAVDGPVRPASALRKKSKYSPSNSEYVQRIQATRSDASEDASSPSVGAGASAAAAAAHKASPAINFSPFNRVNLIPAKEEYDEYKADFDPDVKTLF